MQRTFAGALVLGEVLHVHRHDLVAEQPIGLSARGALLALQGIEVLLLAGDVVAPRHQLGGLAHGVVDTWHALLDDRVEQVIGVAALQRQGDGLDPAGDDDVAAARGDLVGRDRDGLQA